MDWPLLIFWACVGWVVFLVVFVALATYIGGGDGDDDLW